MKHTAAVRFASIKSLAVLITGLALPAGWYRLTLTASMPQPLALYSQVAIALVLLLDLYFLFLALHLQPEDLSRNRLTAAVLARYAAYLLIFAIVDAPTIITTQRTTFINMAVANDQVSSGYGSAQAQREVLYFLHGSSSPWDASVRTDPIRKRFYRTYIERAGSLATRLALRAPQGCRLYSQQKQRFDLAAYPTLTALALRNDALCAALHGQDTRSALLYGSYTYAVDPHDPSPASSALADAVTDEATGAIPLLQARVLQSPERAAIAAACTQRAHARNARAHTPWSARYYDAMCVALAHHTAIQPPRNEYHDDRNRAFTDRTTPSSVQ